MPLYEYRCETCGNQFDAIRLMKDADAIIQCCNCYSTNTHRLLSKCYSHGKGENGIANSGGCNGCGGGNCGTCRR